MLQNEQIIKVIPLPGDLFGKKRALLISHFIWIGGFITIRGSVGFFDSNETEFNPENRFIPSSADESIFQEYEFQDITARRDRLVNAEGVVVPEKIFKVVDGVVTTEQEPNPDVYKNEYDYFRQLPLEIICPNIQGKVIEEPILTAIEINALQLWNKNKIIRK
jgi:hypothetical protein